MASFRLLIRNFKKVSFTIIVKDIFFYFGLCITGSILIISCECIPSNSDFKTFIPDDAANILFINAMPDIGEVDFQSDLVTKNNFKYDSISNSYFKIDAGTKSIRFLKSIDKAPVFNGIVSFKTGSFYTVIGYGFGTGSKIRALIVSDSIPNFSPENSYIRFFHVSSNSEQLLFNLTNSTDTVSYNILYKSFTNFEKISPGKYKLEIKLNDSLLLSNNNVNIASGHTYSFVLRGYYGGIGAKELDCQIVEVERK